MARARTAALAALAGAAAGVLSALAIYIASPDLVIEFGVNPPRLVTGIHPAEIDQATGLTFAWTARDAALRVPDLDRRVPWTATIRLQGARQAGAENPTVAFAVDGAQAASHSSETAFTTVRLQIPPRPERPRGLLLTMEVSDTFRPGPHDPRPLGVKLDRVRLAPGGLAWPPADALRPAALSAGIIGAAFGFLGLAPAVALGGAALIGVAQGSLLTRGFGPFTNFPEHAAATAAAVALGLLVASGAIEGLRRRRLETPARITLAITAAALLLKVLVQIHPGMPIGDALFQAHRFQEVLGGNYYFTSIAPGNYLFPYAPGLYVAAAPFADFVRREMGDVMLLRIFAASADAVAGALLYWAVVRNWNDGAIGALAAGVYHLLPLTFLVAAGGTLTNAFAQSLAVGALVVLAASCVGLHGRGVIALTMICLAAYLSHTSTFAILSVTTVAVAVLFAWRGGPDLRAPALAVLLAGVAAAVLAVAIYYGHFMETYRTELARIGAETAQAAPDAGGRTVAARAAGVPMYLNTYFGPAPLVLALAGALRLLGRGARDRLTLAVAGWSATCMLFLLIGVLTPVDMRYYVAALPAVAMLAGYGAWCWWRSGPFLASAAAAFVFWAAWRGIKTWWGVLG